MPSRLAATERTDPPDTGAGAGAGVAALAAGVGEVRGAVERDTWVTAGTVM